MLGFPIMMRSIANSLTMPTIMMRSRLQVEFMEER
jgi:hypothetical protein